jgi:hypothetical protein
VPDAYEWTVLRAVPRVERCEFVNVGAVVYCQGRDYLAAKVSNDLSRVQALRADVELDVLREHLRAIEALCAGAPSAGENGRRPPGERFRWLVAPRSTMVQCSPVHTGVTEDPAGELVAVFDRMVSVV